MIRAGLLATGFLLTSLLQPAGASPQTPRRVYCPVIIFHHVKWLKPSDDAIERGLTVLPPRFTAELRYLAAQHYHPVTAARLVSFLRGGPSLPSRPVVISFDDGYNDAYTNTFRMLRAHHMVATFFIVPGFLGQPRYLTWAQVDDMARHGMDIEAHSMTHPDLTVVPRAQARVEIMQSRLVLQRRLHRPVRIFAYPYGAYNPYVVSQVANSGYWAAFTTHQGRWQSSDNMLTLPRVYVDANITVGILGNRENTGTVGPAEGPV